jgi:hypothetical protein
MNKFPKNEFTDTWRAKNVSAQALGRLGGIARAKKLSKEQLSEISKKGNDAKRAKKLLA